MDWEQLRRLAENYAEAPANFELVMEDSIPKENAMYRVFVWENPENREETIEVELDLHSKEILRLQMYKQAEPSSLNSPSIESAEVRAQEMLERYLIEPNRYMLNELKYIEDKVKVDYRLQIGGLPLPHTGCELILTRDLELVRFRFEGNKDIPELLPHWPLKVIEPDIIRANLLSSIDMELSLRYFYPTLYDYQGSDSEFRLVYTAVPERQFICADTGADLFDEDHFRFPRSEPMIQAREEFLFNAESHCESVSDSIDSVLKKWEERLGIDLSYFERDEVKEEEGEIRCLYTLRNQSRERYQDLSHESYPFQADAYLKHKWGNILDRMFYSCKLSMDAGTGSLLSFQAFDKEEDTESIQETLSRSGCRKIAEQFLADVFPNYGTYLHREVDNDFVDGERRKKEFFFFPLFISGIPVSHEQVTVVVNTRNGRINGYRGLSPHLISELMSLEHQPKLSAEEAFQRYRQQMDVQLKWFLHTVPSGKKEYRLVYENVVKYMRESEILQARSVFIDASTGEWIYRKE